ncbi:MAG: hypothetical protein KatS3mg077_0865 [Candidatus Binatia bacterium]|nr:MAG: hypothetical protein KatS3mg077_0865 [Candidatus Binatia bacterium]
MHVRKACSWWVGRKIFLAAATVATLAWGPIGTARAACLGDCGGDGEVTVNEIITMVNIALGNAPVSTCPVADPNGDGQVTIEEIIQAVNSLLSSQCIEIGTGEAVCGNGVREGDEECDDGGICVGTAKAGQTCQKDDDCFTANDQYKGVCDGGEKPYTFCNSNDDCPGGKCVACRTFGGDGCAANCTNETTVNFSLVPGVVNADQSLQPGTSGAVVWGDPLVLGLSLKGSQQLKIGKERNGQITAVIPAASVQFDQIPISTLACACVRGAEYKTCGGAIFNQDGSFVESCTEGFASDPSSCEGQPPCTAVFGPGNSAAGVVGCTALTGINVSIEQDSCPEPNGPVQLSLSGDGGPGSALLVNAIGIGTMIGQCTQSFCTDADPPASRGNPNPLLFTTGQACATVLCKNNDPSFAAEPKCVEGQPASCANLSAGNITGLTLGGAFTALDQQTLGDIEVTNILVAQ